MSAVNIVVGIAVLGWLMWNQVQVREVNGRRMRIAAGLAVVGTVQLLSVVSRHPVPWIGWVALVLGLAVGVALASWRAAATRLWVQGGSVMRQGSAFTAALWLVGVAVHVALGFGSSRVSAGAEEATSSSVLLFVGVSLLVQSSVVGARARRLTAAADPRADHVDDVSGGPRRSGRG